MTASFKTDLAPDAAVDDAMAALTGNGWALVETNSSILGMSNAVFASAGPPRPEVACLDDQAVSVNANAIDGVTYVNYGIQVGAPSTACSPNGRMLSSPGAQYAPQLSLPIDPATGQTARTGGGGSSGTQSRVEIRYSGSLAELTQFMTQQLIDQGWVNDASWSGSTTAGSSWVKKPDDETRVAGTLDVTATTGANYTIMFRLVGLQ